MESNSIKLAGTPNPAELEQQRDITIITGPQDYKKGRAFIAVSFQKLAGYRLTRELSLVTSELKKIPFNEEKLMEVGIVAERRPYMHSTLWEENDLNDFLSNGESPTIAEVHSNIVNESQKLFDFTDKRYHEFIGLWIIGTYFHRMFVKYPYIHLNGNAGSGKTKCLTFISNLAFNGVLSSNNTPAYMIRIIHYNHATCCLDEVESLKKSKDEDSKAIVGMLNAGYKRGSFVGKSEQDSNNKWVPKLLESYSPKVLAGIQNLPHALNTRCVPIVMLRSNNPILVNTEVDEQDDKWQIVRNYLYRLALTRHKEIENQYIQLKDNELLGRSWELWHPMLAIAASITEELYQRMRGLALEAEATKKQIEKSNNHSIEILSALYDRMKRQELTDVFYTTGSLYETLSGYDPEEFGWLESPEKKFIRGRWLTNQLRLAGAIVGNAEQKKISGNTTKGYTFNRDKLANLLKSHGVDVESADYDINNSQTPEELADSIPF